MEKLIFNKKFDSYQNRSYLKINNEIIITSKYCFEYSKTTIDFYNELISNFLNQYALTLGWEIPETLEEYVLRLAEEYLDIPKDLASGFIWGGSKNQLTIKGATDLAQYMLDSIEEIKNSNYVQEKLKENYISQNYLAPIVQVI